MSRTVADTGFKMSRAGGISELRELVARNAQRLDALEATIGIGHNGGPPLDDREEGKPVLLSDRNTAARYDVSTRTLARWDETPGLGFPPPVYIRDRRYRELAKLEEWDRNNARKAATHTKPRGHGRRFAKSRITASVF